MGEPLQAALPNTRRPATPAHQISLKSMSLIRGVIRKMVSSVFTPSLHRTKVSLYTIPSYEGDTSPFAFYVGPINPALS